MKRRLRGFTLIELIVIISVIGILAGITVVGFGRYQADTRDARRAASVVSITEALEKYYDEHGEYPSCADLVSGGSEILEGVSQSALLAPSAEPGSTTSISCSATLTVNGDDFFEYEGDGSAECLSGSSCLEYTLKYKEESSNQIISVDSRRSTSIATSGIITNLTAAPSGGTNVYLDWSSIANTNNYTVQLATNSSFTTGLAESTSTSSDTTVSIPVGVQHYFRVRANSPSSLGLWSNTATATLISQGSITGTSASACGQVTVNWSSLAGASSYQVKHSVNSNMSGATTITGATGTSLVISGLSQGVTIYFTVAGETGAYTGQESTISSQLTTVCAPAAYNVSCSNDGVTLTCTSQATCGAGATRNYYWYANGSPWVTGDQYQSVAYSLGYDQSVTLTVNTRCYTGANPPSAWVGSSNSGSLTRGIPAPGGYSWIQSVVSNNLNYYWNQGSPGCVAGARKWHVWTIRRSTGQVYLDQWLNDTNTTQRTGGWPVASWDSYLQAYCDGNTGDYYGGTAYHGVG